MKKKKRIARPNGEKKEETAKNGKTARELAQSACAQRLAFANEAIN